VAAEQKQIRYENIVIGNSLSAALFSYCNKYPLIINSFSPPTPFEFLPTDLPLDSLGLDAFNIELNGAQGKAKFGMPKIELWNKLTFLLSMSGLQPCAFRGGNVRVHDDKIEVYSKSRMYSYEYENAFVFDSENVSGINVESKIKHYKVFDWIDVKALSENDIDYIKTDDNFVNEIFFYPSERNGAKSTDKDIVCISTMTEDQLKCFDYSDTIVKMKTKHILKQHGLKGSRSGPKPGSPLEQNHRPIKLETSRRDVRKVCFLSSNENRKSIVIDNRQEKEIIGDFQQNGGYLSKFNTMLKRNGVLIS
jgi:hypothetical protein